MTTTTKWLAGINGLLGLWLIAAPFVFGAASASLWNAVIVGAAIAVIGWYDWNRTRNDEEVSSGAAGLNALLGLWMIAAPFVFAAGTAMLWNNVIVGAAVAIFAGYNAYVATQTSGQRGAQPA